MNTEVLCIWAFACSYTNTAAINIWSLGHNVHSHIKINKRLTVHSNIKINKRPGWDDVTGWNPQEFIIRRRRNTCNTWHLRRPFQIAQALHNNPNIMFLLTCGWPLEMMSAAGSELWVTGSKRWWSTQSYVFDPACEWTSAVSCGVQCQKRSYLTLSFHYLKLLKESHVTLFMFGWFGSMQTSTLAVQSIKMTTLSLFTHSRVALNLYAVITSVELKRRIFTQIIVTSFQLWKEQENSKNESSQYNSCAI